jgi:peptidylprolyl isomerase
MVDAALPSPPKDLTVLSRRARALAAATGLAVLALTACGQKAPDAKPNPLSQTTVTGGSETAAPKVTLKPTPLTVTETTTRVVKPSQGQTVTGNEIVSLRYVLLNGKDGSQIDTNFGKQNLGLNLADAQLLPGLKKGLTGQKVGSQVLIAMPPKDAFGTQGNTDLKVGANDTVVFLMDVLGTQVPLKSAQGKAVPPKKGLPTVKVEPGKEATITVPKGEKPPTKTVDQLLVQGQGAQVEKGQTVRITYTGALWKNGKNFDSSAKNPGGYWETPIGVGQVIKGWDNGLVGKHVGDRVLLVVPPADGYGAAGSPPKISGTDTLVFVVDILAAY